MALNAKQLDALTKVVPKVLVQTEIEGLDEPIPQHPVGVRPYVEYVVRRFKSVRDEFLGPLAAASALHDVARGVDGKPDEYEGERAFMRTLDLPGKASQAIDDRYEADTAFVALSLCHPRNLKELQEEEAKVVRLSDEAFDALYLGAQRATYGENLDPTDFMRRVGKRTTGMDLTTMFGQSLATEPDATA